ELAVHGSHGSKVTLQPLFDLVHVLTTCLLAARSARSDSLGDARYKAAYRSAVPAIDLMPAATALRVARCPSSPPPSRISISSSMPLMSVGSIVQPAPVARIRSPSAP